jgi:KaiC/GvpD/RAD55 family RecA-like ATPase
MRFRNLRAEELEGSTDIAGLDPFLHSIGATDAAVLLMAPPGTGKAAAVGKLAHRLGRDVVLCNLMEVFDYPEPLRQLENLLRLCEAERERVIYLDKLDKALDRSARAGDDSFARTLENWLAKAKQKLLDDQSTVVFTGRTDSPIPESLVRRFDKVLNA